MAFQQHISPRTGGHGFGGSFRTGMWGDRPAAPITPPELLEAFQDIAQEWKSQAVPPKSQEAPAAKPVASSLLKECHASASPPAAFAQSASLSFGSGGASADTPATPSIFTRTQAPVTNLKCWGQPRQEKPASVGRRLATTPTRELPAPANRTGTLLARHPAAKTSASHMKDGDMSEHKRREVMFSLPAECRKLTDATTPDTKPSGTAGPTGTTGGPAAAQTQTHGTGARDRTQTSPGVPTRSKCQCRIRHSFKSTCGLNLRWHHDNLVCRMRGEKPPTLKKWLQNKSRSKLGRAAVSKRAPSGGLCHCRHRHAGKRSCVPVIKHLIHASTRGPRGRSSRTTA